MRLNLRQIEVFRAVMLTGSISGAARLLHVSQPAVSRLVSYTETRLEMAMFERIKGRLCPTPEARRLFVEVDSVYQAVQRVNQLANDLLENRSGTLRVAANPSLSQTLIPMAIAQFRQRHPDVRVQLLTLVSPHLAQAVLTQSADIGVATIFKQDHPNLVTRALYEDRLVAVLPASSPLADKPALHVRDLADQTLIGYGRDTPFGQLVEQMYEGTDAPPRPAIEVRLTHIACAMVQAGAGVAIVDEMSVNGRVWPDIVVRPIEPATAMPVTLLRLRLEPLSRLAQDFVDLLSHLKYHSLRSVHG